MNNSQHKPDKIRKSRKFSLLDGLFAASMAGETADYITPYALTLEATTGQIGFLSVAPDLASALIQLKSPDLTEKLKSRKWVNFLVGVIKSWERRQLPAPLSRGLSCSVFREDE
jgi:hypothetical protein